MAGKSPHQPPRVSLFLRAGALRDQIRDVLTGADVEVDILEERADLQAGIQSVDADVVLIHTDQLDSHELDELTDAAEGGTRTGIAIIGEDHPGARARLFAAGASHVIGRSEAVARVGESLGALAETEADGGLQGPDVRGSEADPRLTDFLTRSPCMREFVELVQRVVPVDSTLLITGPTGVGKEHLARAIHAEGARSGGPFSAVNCGALPETLLESELFGHERGAFTGADRQRKGHFELGSRGTVFLDEIGEMAMHLQVKLLTVLQRHEVVRLGGQRPIPVDVRVIAATNRDLGAEVAARRFREDLYYRLNVVELELPALAARPEDVPDLAGRFIAHFRNAMPGSRIQSISDAAVAALMVYAWPGNVRELINVIERAMVLGTGAEITLEDLPPHIARGDAAAIDASRPATAGPATAGPAPIPFGDRLPETWGELTLREIRDRAVRRAESAYLRAQLEACGGRVAETAARAGLSTRALYDRLRRYDLRKEDFKP
jgi:DNA-binding NtrC family response regulator